MVDPTHDSAATVAAAAERAGSERRRRRAAPLLAQLEADSVTATATEPVVEPGPQSAPRPVARRRPTRRPATDTPAPEQDGAPTTRDAGQAKAAPPPPAAPPPAAAGKVRLRRPAASRRTPGGERLVAVPIEPDGDDATGRPVTGRGAHPSMRYAEQRDAEQRDAEPLDASAGSGLAGPEPSPAVGPATGPGAGAAMAEEVLMRLLGRLSELAPMVETVAESLTGSLVESLSRDPGAVADVLGLGALGELGDRLDLEEIARWLRQRLPGMLEFARTRMSGDYAVDDFGFDPEFTEAVLLTMLRPLYQRWFRVEVRGVENIPATGGALVVANHAGAIAFDSLMTAVAIHDEHPQHRYLRTLGADLVFRTPVLAELARRGGATLASTVDAERLLSAGELVGVWPEGFKGIGKPYSERYKLQRFGRGGFVSAALRTRTPIVPCAIVGSEEIYPILGNLPTLARILGLPYLPITPTFPLLGPLGLLPLPSKWLIEFGEPVATDSYPAGAADDPMLVFDLTDQVRQTIQQGLFSLLVRRQSVFR